MARLSPSVAFAASIAGFLWSPFALAQGDTSDAPHPTPSETHEGTPASAAPAPPAEAKWYEQLKLEAFVDAYSSWNLNFPKPQYDTNAGRALDNANGFALRWVGANVGFIPDPDAGHPVGGFVSLRFGPATLIYAAPPAGSQTPPDTTIGAGNIKEAYASWKPLTKLQIDIGKFGTWIGSEWADSQYNMNYTPSPLFYTQPAWHTGLRVDLPLTQQLDLKLFVVQGINNTFDNNAMKSFGVSAAYMPAQDVSFYLNYMGGPEQPDVLKQTTVDPITLATSDVTIEDPDANGRWRHLVDAVADVRRDRTHMVVNADLGTERLDAAGATNTWYGANLTVGYALTDVFALAARAGYTADAKGTFIASNWGSPLLCGAPAKACRARVSDATLTLAVAPTSHLLIKLEPRLDHLENDDPSYAGVYLEGATGHTKNMFTATLGVVATTN